MELFLARYPKDRSNQKSPLACSAVRARAIFCVIVLFVTTAIVTSAALSETIYVRTSSKEATLNVTGLDNVLDALRKVRPTLSEEDTVEVVLAPGIYRLSNAFDLNEHTIGKSRGKLIIRGAPDGTTKLLGSRSIAIRAPQPGEFGPQLPASHVLIADIPSDLRHFALSRRGTYVRGQESGLEFYSGPHLLHLSRWPKDGYSTAIEAATASDGKIQLSFPNGRVSNWRDEQELWLGGYWARDWAYEFAPLERSSRSGSPLWTAQIVTPLQSRTKFRYFIANAVSELDQPGEFVFDTKRQVIAFILPSEHDRDLELAVASQIIKIDHLQNVEITNIGLGRSLGDVVDVTEATNVTITHCTIFDAGMRAISVTASLLVKISDCSIRNAKDIGVFLSGGDRRRLLPSGNEVRRSEIYRANVGQPDFRPAVVLSGVGNSVVESKITGGAQGAIIISGNNNSVIRNDIANVGAEADDAGAIYLGRDWTQRGNEINANCFRNIGPAEKYDGTVSGVYLDDQVSGTTIKDNLFLGIGRPVILGGGRDNKILQNGFVGARVAAIFADNRGETWQKFLSEADLIPKLNKMPTKETVWSTRYPELAALTPADYGKPRGNVAVANVVVGSALLKVAGSDSEVFAKVERNTVEPLFNGKSNAMLLNSLEQLKPYRSICPRRDEIPTKE